MLETEAQHGPLNFSQERCNADEKRQFVQNYEAAVRQVQTHHSLQTNVMQDKRLSQPGM